MRNKQALEHYLKSSGFYGQQITEIMDLLVKKSERRIVVLDFEYSDEEQAWNVWMIECLLECAVCWMDQYCPNHHAKMHF